MSYQFTDTSIANVKSDVALNSAGYILEDGQTPKETKTIQLPMVDSQVIIARNTAGFNKVRAFQDVVYREILGLTFDYLSNRATIEFKAIER